MSLEQLLGEEPELTVLKQVTPGDANLLGVPKHSLETLKTISGRLALSSSSQVSAWLSLGIEANYELITEEGEIDNGHFVKYSQVGTANGEEDRTFRVMGSGGRRYSKGNIPTYWKYPLLEVRTT